MRKRPTLPDSLAPCPAFERYSTTVTSVGNMTEKMYYWGEERDPVDPDQTFIEFKAKITPAGESSRAGPRKITTSPQIRSCNEPVVGVSREDDEERGGWGNKLDFLFSCISVSVGLGNVWRFPYLCYKNGGGAFLVTYGIAMVFCGIPIFFQEVAIGQYLGAGGMTLVGQLCPILQGVGYATMTIVFFLDVYYCIIIAWTLFYLISTFARLTKLPWSSCGYNWWNTDDCFDASNGTDLKKFTASHSVNLSHNESYHHTTPVEEYWERRVLGITGGIEEIGGMQWELLGCLVIGWLLVYFIIRRGLHQSGKIIWFSALFPYVVLFILLGRAVTLDGAETGTEVSNVVKSGPGLVFLTYPEVVLKLVGAPIWAIIFFFMLIILGLDSEFCIVESFITGVVDNWPDTLRPHRNKFTVAICILMFLLGVPMVTHFIFVFQCVQYKPLKYGSKYEYPTWAEVVGFCLSFSSMIWIPAYAIYYVLATPGSIKENILKGIKPNIKSRTKLPTGEKSAVIPMSESSAGLITKNSSFLSQT
ncbi:hypothetical protein G9C98_004608 [Cotesia typhae]|uniref:Transporter n=1 Tax=Cotesia typhae TaxID=2053667 RepID=A0A8J5R2Q5_9HYME|nr:hypothetical protein G9C98_004608 [Cotesia typhae]